MVSPTLWQARLVNTSCNEYDIARITPLIHSPEVGGQKELSFFISFGVF
jgi:hypothetical protein